MTIKPFDFVGKKNIFLTISAILISGIILSSIIFGVLMDIQFKGGSIITYSYTGEMNFDEVTSFVEKTISEEVSISEKKGISGKDSFDIVLASDEGLSADLQSKLSDAMKSEYGTQIELLNNSSVDPTIGKEFFLKGIAAVALASVILITYIAFRFKKINGLSAGVTAVLALVHDVIMVFGAFIVFRIPIGDNFIAVVLTILGYSINDTIVIYDRIRENKKIYGKDLSINQLVNKSINESMTRTINTSIATISTMIVVCVVSMIAGVTSIVSFALPMIIGMISGTYSTVFIAGPLWVMWQNHKDKKSKKTAEVA